MDLSSQISRRGLGKAALGGALGAAVSWPQLSSAYGESASAEAPHWGEGGVPQFKLDPNFFKVPSQWTVGSVSDITADGEGNIWLLSRPRLVKSPYTPAPPVMEFDTNGNFIQGWGGKSGPEYQWPTSEHGIFVDHKGFVWIIGNWPGDPAVNVNRDMTLPWDNQIIKFTNDGKFVMAIGKSGQIGSNSTLILGAPTDIYLCPKTNELFVSDGYMNSRIIVFDADTGEFKRMWGAYGHKPVDKDKRPQPAPLTPDPWRRVAEVTLQFGVTHDVKISKDGLVYVADRGNSRFQVFTLEGKFLIEKFIGLDIGAERTCGSITFSPGEQFMYVGGGGFIWILNRRTHELLGEFPSSGHLIGADNKGNIYAASVRYDPLHLSAYKYAFTGYSPKRPCPPFDTSRTDLK